MSIDMSQFLATFFEESFEGLELMESGLLNLDTGAADTELVNSIFRAAHSIKGGSATFGLNEIASFTHVMETLLDELRDGRREATPVTVDVLLRSVDCLRAMLVASRDGRQPDTDLAGELEQQMSRLLADSGAGAAGTWENPAPAPSRGWRIRFSPHPQLFRTGNDPLRILRELAELGDCRVTADTDALPDLETLCPEDSYLAWHIELQGAVARDVLDEVFAWVEDDCELEIHALEDSDSDSGLPEPAAGDALPLRLAPPAHERREGERRSGSERRGNERAAAAAADSSIRVSIRKIDELINMVGELVITQSMLGQVGSELEDFSPARVEKLRDGLALLERNTRELQESVMQIRMLPISFAFNRFPRLVHDLSGRLGKKVDLRISGESTELDKTVMEKIGDPLVHLVRNALDHGIEAPAVRAAAGKPETGVVSLNAFHHSGNIVIEISDDGGGLDAERILRQARLRGLVGEDDTLSREKALELIFEPGFSTAEQVSDVSGRGVGMDVVRRNIKDLGGSIEVRSRPGAGSTFTIRLPLTLAILDGQLVSVGGETFIMPLISIVESLQVRMEQVNTIGGRTETYRLREHYIPIVRLYRLFGIEPRNSQLDRALLVVVESEGNKIGLLVDELLGQQQVVVKSLETNFRRVEGLSGATILGDGTVAMILDPAGLVSLSGNGGSTFNTQGDSERAA